MGFLESVGPWSTVVFVLLQAFQVVAAPIPGEATGILGGYLYGPYLGTLLSTIGLTIGSLAAFLLSRYLGRPFAERFVAPSTMERFDYLLHHKGVFLDFSAFSYSRISQGCPLLSAGSGPSFHHGISRHRRCRAITGNPPADPAGELFEAPSVWVFYSLVAVGVVVILLVMIFKDKLERLFRQWYSKKHPKKDPSVRER